VDALPAPDELLAICAAIGTVIGALPGVLLAEPDQRLRDEIIGWATIGGIIGTIFGLAVLGGGALADATGVT